MVDTRYVTPLPLLSPSPPRANHHPRTEILPIFSRLELEKGKWVPRFWPPNLGAPRDIPTEGVLHPSVNEMIKAGILDPKSVPEKGGDNPIALPDVGVADALGAWSQAAKRRAAEMKGGRRGSGSSEDTLVEGLGEKVEGVKDKVGEGLEGVKDKVGDGVERVKGDVQKVKDGIGEKVGGIGKGVEGGVDKLKGDVGKVGDQVGEKLGGLGKLAENGTDKVKGDVDKVKGDLGDKVNGLGKLAQGGLGSLTRGLRA